MEIAPVLAAGETAQVHAATAIVGRSGTAGPAELVRNGRKIRCRADSIDATSSSASALEAGASIRTVTVLRVVMTAAARPDAPGDFRVVRSDGQTGRRTAVVVAAAVSALAIVSDVPTALPIPGAADPGDHRPIRAMHHEAEEIAPTDPERVARPQDALSVAREASGAVEPKAVAVGRSDRPVKADPPESSAAVAPGGIVHREMTAAAKAGRATIARGASDRVPLGIVRREMTGRPVRIGASDRVPFGIVRCEMTGRPVRIGPAATAVRREAMARETKAVAVPGGIAPHVMIVRAPAVLALVVLGRAVPVHEDRATIDLRVPEALIATSVVARTSSAGPSVTIDRAPTTDASGKNGLLVIGPTVQNGPSPTALVSTAASVAPRAIDPSNPVALHKRGEARYATLVLTRVTTSGHQECLTTAGRLVRPGRIVRVVMVATAGEARRVRCQSKSSRHLVPNASGARCVITPTRRRQRRTRRRRERFRASPGNRSVGSENRTSSSPRQAARQNHVSLRQRNVGTLPSRSLAS